MIRNKYLFYLLSFTWGIIMSLIGSIVFAILMCCGYEPEKYGYCYRIEIGNNWGGVSLGPFFLTSKNPTTHTKDHELGHSIQGCFFGPLMPFLVCIPSVIRYWYRVIRQKIGKPCSTPYDGIWFEGQATRLGEEFMTWLESTQNN
jgi:hypothetical protein